MDSVNDSFITSSKVSLLEHQSQQQQSLRIQKTNKILIIIIFSFIILASLIAGTITLSLMHKYYHNTKSTESPKTNSANSVKLFCSVTQDPELCFTSLSSAIKESEIDPDYIFAISLKVAMNNVTSLVPLMREILLSSSTSGAESALEHCTWSFADSLSHLNKSLSTLGVDPGMQALTSDRREDLLTWLVKAMSALDICGDVLDDVGSTAVNEFSVKVYKARVQVSNSRDFLSYEDIIMEKIHPGPVDKIDNNSTVNFEYFSPLFMFFPQYLVLIFLLYLLLRVY